MIGVICISLEVLHQYNTISYQDTLAQAYSNFPIAEIIKRESYPRMLRSHLTERNKDLCLPMSRPSLTKTLTDVL